MKELKQKEREILKYLKKHKEGDFMTKIAFHINCNSTYTKSFLKTLKKYKLIEKIRFGRFFYWRITDDKNKM